MGRASILTRCLAGAALLTCVTSAQAPPPDKTLRFVIEPGSHYRAINDIDTDAAETLAVTGSDDRTVRIWDISNGRLLQTLYLPVTTGDPRDGTVTDVAMSPDGNTIAYTALNPKAPDGGRIAYFTFDRLKNTVSYHNTLKGNRVTNLQFSTDGKWLVYSTAETAGITGRAQNFNQAENFRIAGAYKACATADSVYMFYREPGNADQTWLRRYSIGPGGLSLTRSEELEGNPVAINCMPDGKWLAVTYRDENHDYSYRIFETPALRSYRLETGKTHKLLGVVKALPDSSGFEAAILISKTRAGLLTWRVGSADPAITQVRKTEGDPRDGLIAPLTKGRFIWSSEWGGWTLYTNEGKVESDTAINSAGLDEFDNIGISEDGTSVFFQVTDPDAPASWRQPTVFSLNDRTAGPVAAAPAGYRFFKTANPGVRGLDIDEGTYNGEDLDIEDGETAVSSDALGGTLYIGTDEEAYALNGNGRKWRSRSLGAPVVQIHAAANGKVVLAITQDGIFHWLSAQTGQPLANAFVTADRHWIAWTPDGKYDASPGGEELGGYVVNRSDKGVAYRGSFYPVYRFRDRFYDPAYVLAALRGSGASVQSALSSAGAPAGVSVRSDDLPTVTINFPSRYTAKSLDLSFPISIDGPADSRISVKTDGKEADGVSIDRTGDSSSSGLRAAGPVVHLKLPERNCTVMVQARAPNGNAWGPAASIEIVWPGAPQKPVLRVLAIGVKTYLSPLKSLALPPKDADDIRKALEHQKGSVYSDVIVKTLLDPDAKQDAIIDSLSDLADQARSDDIVVIFLAGHGVASKGSYYFVPYGFESHYESHAVDFDAIVKQVARIKGRTVVMIDTCHSGGFDSGRATTIYNINRMDMTRVADSLSSPDQGGAYVLTASQGNQESQESVEKWNNGAFTKAVIEGLTYFAARKNGDIRLESLSAWLACRVPELTSLAQKPTSAAWGGMTSPDFVFARRSSNQRPQNVTTDCEN